MLSGLGARFFFIKLLELGAIRKVGRWPPRSSSQFL
jgi:hypothetical protein